MKKITAFLKNDPVLFLWVLCIGFNIITFLFVRYKIHPTNRTLALHYSIITGVDWYGKGKNLYSLPVVAAGISLVNFILAELLKKSGNFAEKLCAFVSFCVQTCMLLAAFFLAHINV